MKNNSLISFRINVLVGLLFCFPVFSAEASIVISISKKESFLSCNEISNNDNAGSRNKFKIDLPIWKKLIREQTASENISFNKNLSYHSRDDSSLYCYYELFSDLTFHFKKILKPVFVNISFLKELKTIKMLC